VRRQNLPMMEDRGPYRTKSGHVMFGFFASYRWIPRGALDKQVPLTLLSRDIIE